jgi:ATP-binding cassette, subfamily C, bacterial
VSSTSSAAPLPAHSRSIDLLRAFVGASKGVDPWQIAAYVALSLGGALAGSLAAVLLVPLVQPGHALAFGGRSFAIPGGMDTHAMMFAVAMMAFALLRWQAARLGARVASRYGLGLRHDVHARLIDASLVSLADTTSAEIANVLTYNIEIIVQGFTALLQLLVAAVTVAVSLAFAFLISPPLLLTLPLLAILALLASRIGNREQLAVSRQYVADLTRLFWLSEDFSRRLRHVRSFERQRAENAHYGAISARLGQGYRRQLELIASGRLALEWLAAIGIAVIFMLAYRLHGVDQTSLIAVCLLSGRLLPYLALTRQSFQQLRTSAPALELWQRYMKLETDRQSSVPMHTPSATGVLHIKRVQLAPPLAGIDIRELSLAPGTMTLVFGDSGIGKSSLVDALAGMMPPAVFHARFGERLVGFDEYRERVRRSAYISQSVRPWQHSVRECLLWAAPDATDEMLRQALADVGLDKRLAGSRDGLDTALSNASSRLSGGELQRLLLAQVILRQPLLALLDEATSALDEASELTVLAAIKRRLPHTIMIVVSHRNGVRTVADQCLVIDRGAVVPAEDAVAESI